MVTTSSLLRFLSSTGYILFAPDRSYVPVAGDAATASVGHGLITHGTRQFPLPRKMAANRKSTKHLVWRHTSLVNEKTHPPIKILSQKRN